MNFRQFVYRNTMRNKPLYLAYFLSTLVSVMVFFTFSTMAFHPILQSGVSQNLKVGMLGSAVLIFGFSFFFVIYSLSIFLQSRKKEFGLLLIQGMSMKQLRRMISLETLVIGFWSIIFGSLLGVGFSQLILFAAKQLIGVNFAAYFPVEAIVLTIVSFSLLFLVSSGVAQFQLPKQTIQQLLKADEQGKGTITFSKVKSVIAFLLLAIGYTIALLSQGMTVIMAFLPVLVVVVIGTFMLFSQLSVQIIEGLKKHLSFFWKKRNLVVFSDLAFRMKDNARSFFLITIVSTVAFVAVGTLYGVQAIFLGVMNYTPYDFQAPTEQPYIQKVDQTLSSLHITAEKASYTDYADEQQTTIHASDYNKVAKLLGKETLSPKTNEAIQLQAAGSKSTVASVKQVTIGQQTLSVTSEKTTAIVPVYQGTFVVSDEVQLTGTANSSTIWLTKDATESQKIAAGKQLANTLIISAIAYNKDATLKGYAPTLFVGIFVSLVFIVSAGSFLYFRLYSDLANDTQKYRMIYRLGLSRKELKKMVYRQVGILFFIPLVVALAHSIVALLAMYHLFSLTMQAAAIEVLAVFVCVHVFYYILASRLYFRSIANAIGMADK